jgi:cell division protein FtsW
MVHGDLTLFVASSDSVQIRATIPHMVTRLDRGILLAMLFLLGLGLVQVYSSSYIFATEVYQDGLFFFRKQLLFAVVAIVLLFVVALLPWKVNQKLGWAAFGLAVLGIILTFVPHIGVKVGGAHRWISLPLGLRFEPAELLRVSFPIALASLMSDFAQGKIDSRWFLRAGLTMLPLLLLLKQPDFGSFVICVALGYLLFFAFGWSWRFVGGSVAVALPILIAIMVAEPYRVARLQSFLNPWSDPAEKGFQVIQSLLSFYSGGLTGVGLGLGQGKLFFLPEAHTDFTLAVLGEEMGFIGFAFVLLLFGFLVFRGFQIALQCQTFRERAVALGLSLILSFSVLINVGVTLGLLPTKGLTLPLLSYGGSSLFCTALAIGWLLSLERESRVPIDYRERETDQ